MMLGETDQEVFGWRAATLGSYCDEFEPLDKGGFIIEFGLPAPDFAGVFPFAIGPGFLETMSRYPRMIAAVSLIHDRNDGSVGYDTDGKKPPVNTQSASSSSMRCAVSPPLFWFWPVTRLPSTTTWVAK